RMAESTKLSGPDLSQGVASGEVAEGGVLLGHVGEEAVLLARRSGQCFAIGASCTHYGGPLAEGVLVGDTVRCPWHHARFDIKDGEAACAPALNAVPCWHVIEEAGRVTVHEKVREGGRPMAKRRARGGTIVIVGGGAAGSAAA